MNKKVLWFAVVLAAGSLTACGDGSDTASVPTPTGIESADTPSMTQSTGAETATEVASSEWNPRLLNPTPSGLLDENLAGGVQAHFEGGFGGETTMFPRGSQWRDCYVGEEMELAVFEESATYTLAIPLLGDPGAKSSFLTCTYTEDSGVPQVLVYGYDEYAPQGLKEGSRKHHVRLIDVASGAPDGTPLDVTPLVGSDIPGLDPDLLLRYGEGKEETGPLAFTPLIVENGRITGYVGELIFGSNNGGGLATISLETGKTEHLDYDPEVTYGSVVFAGDKAYVTQFKYNESTGVYVASLVSASNGSIHEVSSGTLPQQVRWNASRPVISGSASAIVVADPLTQEIRTWTEEDGLSGVIAHLPHMPEREDHERYMGSFAVMGDYLVMSDAVMQPYENYDGRIVGVTAYVLDLNSGEEKFLLTNEEAEDLDVLGVVADDDYLYVWDREGVFLHDIDTGEAIDEVVTSVPMPDFFGYPARATTLEGETVHSQPILFVTD